MWAMLGRQLPLSLFSTSANAFAQHNTKLGVILVLSELIL
jgi:hypothetical protein